VCNTYTFKQCECKISIINRALNMTILVFRIYMYSVIILNGPFIISASLMTGIFLKYGFMFYENLIKAG
jgi:hypothetical protein